MSTSILMPMQGDFRDEYRREYNQMLLDKATGANGITQEKYITISVVKKDIEEARAYFARVGADLDFPLCGPWAPSAWSWTPPSACVSCTISTARARRPSSVFNAREMMKHGATSFP